MVPNNLLCLDENSRRLLFDSYLAQLGGRGQDKSSFPLELSVKAAKSAGGTGYQRFSFTASCRQMSNPKKVFNNGDRETGVADIIPTRSLNNGNIEIVFAHIIPTRRFCC